MPRYKTKPVEIEAFQLPKNFEQPPSKDLIAWLTMEDKIDQWEYIDAGEGYISIKTLEGDMIASLGDYIIRGLKGELYPCKPEIFEMKYELMES